MGMYDDVNYECVCPICKSKVDGFQSKSGDCTLNVVEPTKVDRFYSSCKKCGCWLEFDKIKKPRKNYTLTVKGKDRNKTLYYGEKMVREQSDERD